MTGGENPYAVTARSRDDAFSALREVEAWLEPAPMEALVKALGELYLRTARRAEDSADRKSLIVLYARELAKFPSDLTLAEIEHYRGTFFPALDDLRQPLERSARLSDRRLRQRAIRHFLAGEPSKPKGPPPTAEQHRKMRELRDALSDKAATERPYTEDDLAALARVDEVHGDKARQGSSWKSIDAVRKEEGVLSAHLRSAGAA